MKPLLVAAAILAVFAPHKAAAQVYVTPFIDTTLSSPSGAGGASQAGYGVAFGVSGKIVGTETEVAYQPEIVDNGANGLGKSHVFTFSQNFLVGPTIGRVKPFGSVGLGDLLLNVSGVKSVIIPSPESITNNYFVVNYGGGAMGFFSSHVGVRGDIRYFKAYGFKLDDLENVGIKFDGFNFWRGSFALALKF